MARYIDKEKLSEELEQHFDVTRGEDGRLLYSDHMCTGEDCDDLLKLVNNLPTADVEEVKHGIWLDDIQKVTTVAGVEFNGFVGYRCSLCGRREPSKEPYCNCGAKMDGGKAE